MKHRELFLSRQVETLPATHIRGKCSVTLLNEEESLLSYLNKDVSSCTVDIPLSQNHSLTSFLWLFFKHFLTVKISRIHFFIASSSIQPKRLS